MSSSPHLQTGPASKIINRMAETFLRCYVSYHKSDWSELFPAAVIAYNSAVTEHLGIATFKIDIGWNLKYTMDFVIGYESN